jgi:RNA polymerase sigma factor (sigma-70 family)
VTETTSLERMAVDQDRRIADVVTRERSRLLAFIRRRVADPGEAEDILQDVFTQLVEANRLLMPIDHVVGWLFRVARNRIVDLFRRKRPTPMEGGSAADEDDVPWEERLPALDAGPEALYGRAVLFATLEAAVEELPKEQRDVFIAHELEGLSFKEIAAATGVSVNTLLSRKRYAVQHLRERLQGIEDDL